MGQIYALTKGDGKYRYVGLASKSGRHRWACHLRDAYKVEPGSRRDYPLYRWIRKHGKENVWLTILEDDVPSNLLGEREIYWIAKLKEEGHDLLNLTSGGDGVPGLKWSDESRAARRGSGNPSYGGMSNATRQRMSDERKSRYQNPAAREKLRASVKKTYDETDIKQRISQLAKEAIANDPERRAKLARASAKGTHVVSHVRKGISKPGCEYCEADARV